MKEVTSDTDAVAHTTPRGGIYHVELNPIVGREQAAARYLVCPITQGGDFARRMEEVLDRLATPITPIE